MLSGRYELTQRLGNGGMGEVWKAQDHHLPRLVAVKMPLQRWAGDPGFLKRFRHEANAMAAVDHPNVIKIHDVYDKNKPPFIVMEYVDGESLADRLHQRARLSTRETMRIVAEAASALQAAHDKGVIHRDVKPGNLLMRRRDGSVVLTDFGIAKTPAANVLTDSKHLPGTPTYMAPELIQGNKASPQSDIYSLGVLAYHCLAGRPPFQAEEPIAVAWMHVREKPNALPSDIPQQVAALVMRALAKRPADRHRSATELARQATTLARLITESGAAPRRSGNSRPPRVGSTPPQPQATRVDKRPPGRRNWRVIMYALLVIALVAGTAIYVVAYVNRGKGQVSSEGSGVPSYLRSFAQGWDLGTCTKSDPPGPHQAERWECDLGNSTKLYLIRYILADDRDRKWKENRAIQPRSSKAADWRSGVASSPNGAAGRYVEFEAAPDRNDWQEEVWWDNGPGNKATPYGLLLWRSATPNAQLALDHLRTIWDEAGYTAPH
jgi:serine/threonine protein kinase